MQEYKNEREKDSDLRVGMQEYKNENETPSAKQQKRGESESD